MNQRKINERAVINNSFNGESPEITFRDWR